MKVHEKIVDKVSVTQSRGEEQARALTCTTLELGQGKSRHTELEESS